jgi:N-methylhydantoinase A
MTSILVPPHAGVLSALGLAIAPERRDAAMSVMRAAAAVEPERFGTDLRALAARAAGGRTGLTPAWHARVRYVGQGHELDVSCAPGDSGAAVAARFSELHGVRYGFTLDQPAEIVAVRVAVTGSPVALQFSAGVAEPDSVSGPAVITLPDATMVIAGGWAARPLPIGGWMVERQ